jgi:hypothetical protein
MSIHWPGVLYLGRDGDGDQLSLNVEIAWTICQVIGVQVIGVDGWRSTARVGSS